MVAFARRGYLGSAAETTLASDTIAGATTIPVADASSWIGITAHGPATGTLDRGGTEERFTFTGISGNSLTGVTRGVDGTTAAFHPGGVKVEHTISGTDMDEANAHYADATLDHHTQYAKTDGTRAFTGAVTLAGDPTVALHAATKQYVDSLAAGLDPKGSVRAATTANITLSGAQTIDGVSVIAGDRVLVKNQTTGSQNGIYVAASGSWARAADADTGAEVTAGLYCFVEEGTANADTAWVLTTANPITLGTTALVFTKFASTTLSKTTRVPHTWGISGSIAVPSGATNFINGMFVPVPAGQTAKLVAVRYVIRAGTSVTFKLQVNGADATGFTGLVATTTAATTDPADVTLADGDLLAPVVTAVSASPDNLSVTAFVEYTVT